MDTGITISEDEFKAYENVRVSGITNMFNVPLVMELSELKRNKVIYIMNNYSQLNKQYPNVRQEV